MDSKEDPILLPPLPDDVFAAKMARWEKRSRKPRRERNVGHEWTSFARQEAMRIDAATAEHSKKDGGQ